MKKLLFLVFFLFLSFGIFLTFYFLLFGNNRVDFLKEEEGQKSFSCPVPREYCSKGKIIELEGEYVGVGYRVPEGTPILAVLPGHIKGSGVVLKESGGGTGRYPGLIISSPSNDLRVHYILTGDDYLGFDNVIQTEEISTARVGNIANFKVNLLVSVYDDQDRLKLEPQNFIKND
ncbi:MAG: hypothetical protein ACOYJ8_00340 [Patescibacteria group bacterium]|jgi:hypothetical protein